jgi:hypothetical protein
MSSIEELEKEIKRLNTELLRTSNRNNLEIEEYEIEINRLNRENYYIHQNWLEIKQECEILKLELKSLNQIIEKFNIKIIK